MALVDIWKSSPEQLKGKTVQQILSFAGNGTLRDGNETSEEFRTYLAHVTSSTLAEHASFCLNNKFTDSGLALQDVVNQIGKRLGFAIEYGRYRGVRNEVGFDGIWKSKSGESILVEVKTTDAYRLSLDTTANYRKKLIKAGELQEEHSSILYVLGRSDTGDLEAQVRGSRHAWDIRLIKLDALLRLLSVKEELDDVETFDKIRAILRPKEYTLVDEIVDLVFTATQDAVSDDVEEEDATIDSRPNPQPKGKKFTTANFRAPCVERLQKHLGETLVKQSAATFSTPDDSLGVLVPISREYHDRSKGTNYWFGYHRKQHEALAQYDKALIAFACGTEEQIVLIPREELNGWLDFFNTTTGEDKHYWHIHLVHVEKTWILETKQEFEHIDVTKYFLK
ncbi:hypothetical protein [Pelagicoccus sp. SDUM812002]|uniref:hypothetical protein n=1 Tax=Pelagicoccus sp. SDUM812002 TaxID=3041266 RepID=UPI00280E485E|nr:hypothetical protein [Pelagicoccus sp. SDUM812002]MDQ8184291.1 hypothetical protein [Pelagicoccus sp. SDUM812002]